MADYEKHFTRLIGEDLLKKLDSVADLFLAIEAEDKKITTLALELRVNDGPNEDGLSANQLREQVSQSQRPERTLARSSDNQNNNNNNNSKPPAYGQSNYPAMPGYGSNNREPASNHRPYAARQNALDEPDLDKSYASDLAFDRVAPEQTSGAGDESDDQCGFDANLLAMMGRGAVTTPPGKNLYDHKAKTPVNKEKPCFSHFRHGCDGRCGGYSHDDADMEKLAYKTLEELVHSKYGGRARTQQNLDRILATMNVQPSPAQVPASRARVSMLTGEPTGNPGSLVPIQGVANNSDASSESS